MHQRYEITKDDIYYFNEGNHFQLYDKLGAHIIRSDTIDYTHFAVWAPNAKSVFVFGDFNNWNKFSHPLQPIESSGIWQGSFYGIEPGQKYKYYVISRYGNYENEKSDPFSYYNEVAPNNASIIWEFNHHWRDTDWLMNRKQNLNHQSPISIYEIHLGSWRRNPENHPSFLTYRELAPLIAEYVLDMGYTHIELMPIMEHPFYASWGYQITNYFSPTSRYGTPDDFMYFIDYLHQHQIGVILDWVPSHFPFDSQGLSYFDGTFLYEHADQRKGVHPDWKSAIFNYGRNEIHSFLISNVLFWLDKYHIDGIRVDAVASMLYLDYSRTPNEWIPNKYGGRENLEAVDFLQKLNRVTYSYYPDIQMIAEESTAWPGVSNSVHNGGLGFGFKWDMGWMHDILRYFSREMIYRCYHLNDITFRMLYAFTENFILSLSHDEVVYGKRSLLYKMPGTQDERFANLRLLFGLMFAFPGKKLLFMGNDFAQLNEWHHDCSLDWHLLQQKPHINIHSWIKILNHIYRTEPALHQYDCNNLGFEWIDCQNAVSGMISFLRKSAKETILVIVNVETSSKHNYQVGVPLTGKWQIIANSDDIRNEHHPVFLVKATAQACHNQPYSIPLDCSALSILFVKHIGDDSE